MSTRVGTSTAWWPFAAGVPLIESGTQGALGQVRAIIKGKTQCYECNPRAPPKEYPICTIRTSPTSHVELHRVGWSSLFKKIFGGEETDLVDTAEGAPRAAATRETGGLSSQRASSSAVLLRIDGESGVVSLRP